MKNLKMKFLYWKDSIRRWCIKKLGGYTNREISYRFPEENKNDPEIVQVLTKFTIHREGDLRQRKSMGQVEYENYIKHEIFKKMYDELIRQYLLQLCRFDDPQNDCIVYRIKLDLVRPR